MTITLHTLNKELILKVVKIGYTDKRNNYLIF